MRLRPVMKNAQGIYVSGNSAQNHLRIWTEVLPTPKSYKTSVTEQAL